ncbi:hypothetical protein BZG36_02163 [Bifiguratus adelaidae]|uniref:Peptidase A1 domain-containing protein n=1 Tax=Bifiguratus adelaidae TaxID=1938954 RepID=A0A261Y0R1_9FUNG|nr:hypothetical protein BZG36_02163 [Bifiguratus adelaidae]
MALAATKYSKFSTGRVPLVNQGKDALYLGNISVGTPPHTLLVNFDTGSSSVLVPTNAGRSDCVGSVFDPGRSKTFHNYSKPFKALFGDQTIDTGYTGTDVIHLGGIAYSNQSLGFITSETYPNTTGASPGMLFSLGFPALSLFNESTSTVELMSQVKAISKVQVGVWLGKQDDPRPGCQGGEFVFGGYNPNHFTGNLTKLTTFSAYYWTFYLRSATLLAKDQWEDIWSSLEGQPVGHSLQFQNIHHGSTHIQYSRCRLSIPNSDMVLPERFNGTRRKDLCLSAVKSAIDENIVILGDTFLKNWYSIYDYADKTVTLAKAKMLM